MLSRRGFVGLVGPGLLVACRGGQVGADDPPRPALEPATAPAPEPAPAPDPAPEDRMLTRTIARTQEALPVIGMGTWQTFDVGDGEAERGPLREVLRAFGAAGGRVIDSSPMYGRAEEVTGDLVAETGAPAQPFLATKVWTRGRAEGEAQLDESMRLLRTARLDLLQVHNLLDFATHITTLRRLRDAGRVRYLGATHYQLGAFADLERVIREEKLDFVQLPYSIAVREAEKRLLPAAADHGVAVLVMRPFEGGDLLARLRGRPLPPLAAALGCTSWAQLLLKWIVGHPAVHCPLPATSKPAHMADNLRAGFGRLPDDAERRELVRLIEESR